MKKILFVTLFINILFFTACKDFVTGVDDPIQAIKSDALNKPVNFKALLNGVKFRFYQATDGLFVLADGLSDQLYFSFDVPGASFTSYAEVNNADITLDNASTTGAEIRIHYLRYFADDLIKRAKASSLKDGDKLKDEMLFNGYFYGAISRYYLGTYFGLEKNKGGHAIENSAFIPTKDLYKDAATRFTSALKYTKDEKLKRIINSYIGRMYLFTKDYSTAVNYIKNGMKAGDEDFKAKYLDDAANTYYTYAGKFRAQYVVSERFADYVQKDPKEAKRIKLLKFRDRKGVYRYLQIKYSEKTTPIPCMSWRENALMLAELSLRGNTNDNALDLVNKVRSNSGLAPLSNVDLDILYTERDKELFCQGLRLPDQRRFNKFHKKNGWQFLPISEQERNENPNIN